MTDSLSSQNNEILSEQQLNKGLPDVTIRGEVLPDDNMKTEADDLVKVHKYFKNKRFDETEEEEEMEEALASDGKNRRNCFLDFFLDSDVVKSSEYRDNQM